MGKTVQENLIAIKGHQVTIDALLKKKQIRVGNNMQEILSEGNEDLSKIWSLESLYNKKDCSVVFASCEDVAGLFPEHVHYNVVEYLICLKGSFVESFGEGGVSGIRIVREGECVSIPSNVIHSSKPLEANTKMVAICVPYDPSFPCPDKECQP
jgi:mannose-6-phosphate isomerase-like protein (cupin superfamily)